MPKIQKYRSYLCTYIHISIYNNIYLYMIRERQRGNAPKSAGIIHEKNQVTPLLLPGAVPPHAP